MLRLIYTDIEDDKDFQDFDHFADKVLDDFHLPSDLLCALDFEKSEEVKFISLDKLQDWALQWHEESTAAHKERFGI